MNIISLDFLLFILLVSLIYYIVPKKQQWIVLLIASYIFYFLNSRKLILVHLFTSIFTYFIGRLLSDTSRKNSKYLELNKESLSAEEKKAIKSANKKKIKGILAVGITVDLGTLIYLKYSNFLIDNINSIFSFNLEPIRLLLPLGISFYTLQAIAYMIDVSKGKCEADTNVFRFMLFMAYFPQILQGPISRFSDLAKQLKEEHEFDYDKFTRALQLMLWGIAQKTIIADRIGQVVNYIFSNSESYSGMVIFFGAVCYSIQIYGDFSGGMDVVSGVSELFGIKLTPNFMQPYFSTSVEEFWRRWHISLGNWMRDYIFYPLSLSKTLNRISKKARTVFGDHIGKKIAPFIAMFIVYLVVGFWHGPDWKYVVYGMWSGTFIMMGILLEDTYRKITEKLRINRDNMCWKLFQYIRTFCLISIGRIFDRATSLSQAISMLKSMLINPFDLSFVFDGTSSEWGFYISDWAIVLIMACIVLLVDYFHEKGISVRDELSKKNIVFRWTVYLILIFAIIILGIYGSSYESVSFIYEQY